METKSKETFKANVTVEDMIKELKREKRMRDRVYPNLIKHRKITRDEANKQYLILEATIEHLEFFENQSNNRK